MKKLFLFLAMALLISCMPMALADGANTPGGITVNVTDPNNPPQIYTDPTERSWYPNDQTIYTANEYGTLGVNAFCDNYYDVGERGDYVFPGETLTYYVAVYDADGEDDIEEIIIQRNNIGVGSCAQIEDDGGAGSALVANLIACEATVVSVATAETYIAGAFNMPAAIAWDSGVNNELWKFYSCSLIVQNGWKNDSDINIKVTDESGASATTWSDRLNTNPDLTVDLNGAIDFGSVEPGQTVTSSTVYLENVGSDGVVMDMYIASDDYFTDPSNPTAICGVGNGIPFTAFSYYATKGSLDSGDNDNDYDGLGEPDAEGAALGDEDGLVDICEADADEFTELPSHSGHIEDMCRIINHEQDGSLLTQGSSMSITFQLDVPTPCTGSFTDGQFHFVGRVV